MKNNSHSDDVTLSQGIVKSHDKFPWHFRRGMRASVVLKSPDPKNRKLLISVYKADVDWEDDVVTIAANDVTVSLNAESARLPPMNGPDVNISLRFDANSRMVAEGFVLCFKCSYILFIYWFVCLFVYLFIYVCTFFYSFIIYFISFKKCIYLFACMSSFY